MVPAYLGLSQLLTRSENLLREVDAPWPEQPGQKISCQLLRKTPSSQVPPDWLKGVFGPTPPGEALSGTELADQASSAITQAYTRSMLSLLVQLRSRDACPALAITDEELVQQVGFWDQWNAKARDKRVEQLRASALSNLATTVRVYRQQAKRAVDEVAEWAKKSFPEKRIQIFFADETERFEVFPEDIAEDCLHLNAQAQVRLAELLHQNEHISGRTPESGQIGKAAP